MITTLQSPSKRTLSLLLSLDPLRVRERLPRAWIERLFALFALWVRARTPSTDAGPEASWRDFPVEASNPESLDLLAICRGARREGLASTDE